MGFIKIIIILLIALLIFSGCIGEQKQSFDLTGNENLDFNPASFEVIKKWNKVNSTRNEFALDNCNMAYRIDAYKWEINLMDC